MRFRIYGIISASKYIGEVEANTKEEAEEKAWSHENMGCCVCHQCTSEVEDPEILEIELEEIKEDES